MNNLNKLFCSSLVAITGGLAACSKDEKNNNLDTQLNGIYEITSFTENDTSCDAEGVSVLEQKTERFLLVYKSTFFGIDFINASSCLDQAECEQQLLDVSNENFFSFSFGYSFYEGNDSAGFIGETVSAFSSGFETTECEGSVASQSLKKLGESGIEIRSENTQSNVFLKREGVCDTDDAKAAAAGNSCSKLEVINAQRVVN